MSVHHPSSWRGADPAANKLGTEADWVHDYRPERAIDLPPGSAAIQVTNGILGLQPGDVAVLPREQAAYWVRRGLARPVMATATRQEDGEQA